MGYVDDLMQNAYSAMEHGDLRVAADRFAQVINLDPTHAEAWYQAGLVLYQTGHTDQALASIEQAITLDANPEYLVNLARIYRGEQELEHAEALLEIALECDPAQSEAWFQLACVQGAQGRFSEALASFEEVKRLPFPADVTHTEIGKVYEASGKISDAISSYEIALSINPASTISIERLSLLSVSGHYHLTTEQITSVGHLSSTFANCPSHAERSAKLTLAEELALSASEF